MQVHLINPSHLAFGVGVITPRWLYVLAAATPRTFGDPLITDETLEVLDPASIRQGDIVGIGIHTGNALRGYEVGRIARERGAWVVFGGIHATLYPEEPHSLGGAHAVVKGRASPVASRLTMRRRRPHLITQWAKSDASSFLQAVGISSAHNTWGFGADRSRVPKHCSFCSVWRTDGQKPRQRGADAVVGEIVELRRRGFRFIALADDNFYTVTLTDIKMAARRADPSQREYLEGLRAERFELMEKLAKLPSDMIFFTQITMEAAEDPAFLEAMRKARIKGALVGVEAGPRRVEGRLQDFNYAARERRRTDARLRTPACTFSARHLRPASDGRRGRGDPAIATRAGVPFASSCASRRSRHVDFAAGKAGAGSTGSAACR